MLFRSAGFEAILTGVRASGADDDQMVAAMTPVLDALYTTFGQETPSPREQAASS